jgi:hypothetical protein
MAWDVFPETAPSYCCAHCPGIVAVIVPTASAIVKTLARRTPFRTMHAAQLHFRWFEKVRIVAFLTIASELFDIVGRFLRNIYILMSSSRSHIFFLLQVFEKSLSNFRATQSSIQLATSETAFHTPILVLETSFVSPPSHHTICLQGQQKPQRLTPLAMPFLGQLLNLKNLLNSSQGLLQASRERFW